MSPKCFTMATIVLFSASGPTHCTLVVCDSEWVSAALNSAFLISTFCCYMAGAMWNCCHLGASSLHTIQSCTSLLSLAGVTTSIIFVATKVLSQQTSVCHEKHMLVVTKHIFCRNKSMFITTKVLSQQAYFVTTNDVFCCNKSMLVTTTKNCCNKIMFVATNICCDKRHILLQQTHVCHDKKDTCGS